MADVSGLTLLFPSILLIFKGDGLEAFTIYILVAFLVVL